MCEYSRSFHDELILQDQASGERSQDQWSSGIPVSWTCENVRLVSEAFTTVEDADINNMNNTEFIDCLADIGSLTSWSATQKTLLLAKTESVSILKGTEFAVLCLHGGSTLQDPAGTLRLN